MQFTGNDGLLVDNEGVLTDTAHSKKYLGVVGAVHGVVETSGEVYVWVSNQNGDLDVGDFITTSNIVGYAMRQNDDILHNYTVGKVLEVCDFTQPQVREKKLITETQNVHTYIKTLKVSLETYSNLVPDERLTEEETYYEKTSKQLVRFNDIVNKMPSYDEECYYKIQTNTVTAEVYNALPESEQIRYELELETNAYTYTQSTYLTHESWSDLSVEEQNTFAYGYFKIVTEESPIEKTGFVAKTRSIYKKIVASRNTEASGYTLHTRQIQVPILDAFGNKTYAEDFDTVGDAYEMRYLLTDGQITTRHNEVYRAALLKVLLQS